MLSVDGPASVRGVAAGRSVTITLTDDRGAFAAAAMPAATLAVLKLAGLTPDRDKPTVVTLDHDAVLGGGWATIGGFDETRGDGGLGGGCDDGFGNGGSGGGG